jgi:hypothetical protein
VVAAVTDTSSIEKNPLSSEAPKTRAVSADKAEALNEYSVKPKAGTCIRETRLSVPELALNEFS